MEIKPNNIYCGDSYELIKNIPDKSVDLVYIDIPYEFVANGGGGCFGEKKRKYHQEYLGVSTRKTYNKQGFKHTEDIRGEELSQALNPISQGISPSIFDELCRVMKYIYIYMV